MQVKIVLQVTPYRVCQIIDASTGKKLDEYAAYKTCVFVCEQKGWEIVK